MKKQTYNLDVQKMLIGLGLVLLVLAGIFYLRSKNAKKPEILPNPEEIMVSEEGMVKKTGELVRPLTEEEIQKMKEEVDGVLNSLGQSVVLEIKNNLGITAEAKRAFSDGKFYLKLTAQNLSIPEKGYFYEGFLNKEDQYLSLGRVEVDNLGNGILYYSVSQDRSDYPGVLLTKEIEDGNPAPGEVLLQGQF